MRNRHDEVISDNDQKGFYELSNIHGSLINTMETKL